VPSDTLYRAHLAPSTILGGPGTRTHARAPAYRSNHTRGRDSLRTTPLAPRGRLSRFENGPIIRERESGDGDFGKWPCSRTRERRDLWTIIPTWQRNDRRVIRSQTDVSFGGTSETLDLRRFRRRRRRRRFWRRFKDFVRLERAPRGREIRSRRTRRELQRASTSTAHGYSRLPRLNVIITVIYKDHTGFQWAWKRYLHLILPLFVVIHRRRSAQVWQAGSRS